MVILECHGSRMVVTPLDNLVGGDTGTRSPPASDRRRSGTGAIRWPTSIVPEEETQNGTSHFGHLLKDGSKAAEAFSKHGSLGFCERANHLHHHSACRRRRVNRLFEATEACLRFPDSLDIVSTSRGDRESRSSFQTTSTSSLRI